MGQGYRSYRVKETKNQSRFYILISMVLLVLIVKWGVPAFVELVASGGGSNVTDVDKSKIPPQRPVFDSIPEATNSGSVSVSGFTSGSVDVTLVVDGAEKDGLVSSSDGSFRFVLELTKGKHKLSVFAVNSDGLRNESVEQSIAVDTDPVILEISEPKEESTVFGVNRKILTVRGKVNKDEAMVKVAGNFVKVESGGNFLGTVELNEGDNEILVSAQDKAGNVTEKKFKVKFSL